MFEKLADRIGRGIRYGEPPAHWWHAVEREVGEEPPENAAYLRRLYDMSYRLHEALAQSAVALGDLIGALEEVEAVAKGEPADEVEGHWEDVRTGLASLRRQMAGMTPVSERRDLGSVGS